MFSSKNHKAVDVLTDRYNSLFADKQSIKRVVGRGSVSISEDAIKSKFEIEKINQQRRVKLNSEIQKNAQKLLLIKTIIDKYEEAVSNIEKVETELHQLQQNNPELQIINWLEGDLEILKLSYWEEKFSDLLNVESRSKNLIQRTMDVFNQDQLQLTDLFNRESFVEKSEKKILSDLKSSFSEDVLAMIGENDLIDFSKRFLPMLIKLKKNGDNWQRYNKIIANTDIDEKLNEWNSLSKENIERSITIIDNEFLNSPNSGTFNNESVTTLSAHHLSVGLKSNHYDLAIMDESSQTDFVSAIPILFRSKRAVVIGDEKQLNPIVTLPEEDDFKLFLSYNFTDEDYFKFGYCQSSLLSVAYKEIRNANFSRVMLKEHFRCHPHIIGFSNHYFYNLDLRVKTLENDKRAIKWMSHNGDCGPKWSNQTEIDIIIKLLNKLLTEYSYSPKQIGIVTPFREHANLLMNIVRNNFNDSFATKLIIDTAHGFQGDEKDVIIFSLVVGESLPKSTYKWMSVKSKNLINVSVTRAREKLFIVGNRENINSRGGILSNLGEWVDYCDDKLKEKFQN